MKVYGAVKDDLIRKDKLRVAGLLKSGYAGIHPELGVVDRREHPEAVPIEENELLKTPEPARLEADK